MKYKGQGVITIKGSELIKTIRTQLGLTQEEFSHAISSTLTTVNRWENEKSTPNRMARTLIADFCEKQGIEKDLIDAVKNIR
jgi:DNA-binding transcriptional regulator YiaG